MRIEPTPLCVSMLGHETIDRQMIDGGEEEYFWECGTARLLFNSMAEDVLNPSTPV